MPIIVKTVVVHGATGQQGGSVVRALSSTGYRIRAAVRDVDSAKAKDLAALPGVELVKVDLADIDSLITAYTGVDAVFACTFPDRVNSQEVAHGKAMADASKAAGVKLHVWSALESIKTITKGELFAQHFDDKAAVTEYIKSIGIPAAYIYLGSFMENYINFPGASTYDAEHDKIVLKYGGLRTDIPLPMVRVSKDVGEVAKIIAAHPDDFVGQDIAIADVTLSIKEHAATIQKVSGKQCQDVQGPELPQFPNINNMYRFANDGKYKFFAGMQQPNPILKKYGFQASTFESFVAEALLPHLKLEAVKDAA
ncbi:NAD(P)-binding protein [Exidia glandulosa HHB12029]|uniref:NAD(P)-binding protein n=1 Tax=Exidia glandulosa HHB12029 TaxID=1314781 RepID=A0A165IW17_EXIGL|nr:NAD(P)-binding protein [Exidia glandulosa HHB12029]